MFPADNGEPNAPGAYARQPTLVADKDWELGWVLDFSRNQQSEEERNRSSSAG
jgi:hypothetical protein